MATSSKAPFAILDEHHVNIGIAPQKIEKVSYLLNQLLADEHVIYLLERNSHWNISGADFSAMHIFFESLYTQTEARIDEVAERIRSLGAFPVASLQEYVRISQFKETLAGPNKSEVFITELLNCHEGVIRFIRMHISKVSQEYGDEGTADFLTTLLEAHEKTAWMLRAHL